MYNSTVTICIDFFMLKKILLTQQKKQHMSQYPEIQYNFKEMSSISVVYKSFRTFQSITYIQSTTCQHTYL